MEYFDLYLYGVGFVAFTISLIRSLYKRRQR